MGGVGKIVAIVILFVIAAVMFPLFMTSVTGITGHANIADFTGLEDMANITPLLLWLAIIAGAGLLTFQTVREHRSKSKKKSR